MPYVTRQEIAPLFTAEWLLQALDDNNDGAEDAGVFEQLALTASRRVDGILGLRFPVPFAAPYPPPVVDAARAFVCEALYLRRMGADQRGNPWSMTARQAEERLQRIALGELPIFPHTTIRGGRVGTPTTAFSPGCQDGL